MKIEDFRVKYLKSQLSTELEELRELALRQLSISEREQLLQIRNEVISIEHEFDKTRRGGYIIEYLKNCSLSIELYKIEETETEPETYIFSYKNILVFMLEFQKEFLYGRKLAVWCCDMVYDINFYCLCSEKELINLIVKYSDTLHKIKKEFRKFGIKCHELYETQPESEGGGLSLVGIVIKNKFLRETTVIDKITLSSKRPVEAAINFFEDRNIRIYES